MEKFFYYGDTQMKKEFCMKNLFAKLACMAMVALTFTACEDAKPNENASKPNENTAPPPLTDARDGKVYKTVKIENMVWMSQNLNFETESSKCFDNNPESCKMYGRLYSWEDAQKACPEGWRLPDSDELEHLLELAEAKAGDAKKSSVVLKSKSGWMNAEKAGGNGTDAMGLDIKPAGFYLPEGEGTFTQEESDAAIWSSTDFMGESAYQMSFNSSSEEASVLTDRKTTHVSVRCVKK